MKTSNNKIQKVPGKVQKDDAHYKDLVKRIIEYFDLLGILIYQRIDVQHCENTDGCFKEYFLSVAINGNGETFYFTTCDSLHGSTSKDGIYFIWITKFIEEMNNYQFEENNRFGETHCDNIMRKIISLKAKTVSELEVKMGILGI